MAKVAGKWFFIRIIPKMTADEVSKLLYALWKDPNPMIPT